MLISYVMATIILSVYRNRMRDPNLPGEDVYNHGELKARSSTRLPGRLTAAA